MIIKPEKLVKDCSNDDLAARFVNSAARERLSEATREELKGRIKDLFGDRVLKKFKKDPKAEELTDIGNRVSFKLKARAGSAQGDITNSELLLRAVLAFIGTEDGRAEAVKVFGQQSAVRDLYNAFEEERRNEKEKTPSLVVETFIDQDNWTSFANLNACKLLARKESGKAHLVVS